MSTHAHVQVKQPSAQAPSFMPANKGPVQRKCADDECRKKKLTLQRYSTDNAEPSSVPPIVHEVLRSPGQPLDPATRTFMEPRFGHDFSKVRVHTDAKAAESARAVNALAYTVGRNIVFGDGQYKPEMMVGRRLLIHELTHVVQQGAIGTAVEALQSHNSIGKTDDIFEMNAELTASDFFKGRQQTQDLQKLFSGVSFHLNKSRIQRAIGVLIQHANEDGTSQKAKKEIEEAKRLLSNLNIDPAFKIDLVTRIKEAEIALETYRKTIDSSSAGMEPALAQTIEVPGNPATLIIVPLLLLAAWIIGTIYKRSELNRKSAKELAEALERLSKSIKEVSEKKPSPKPEELPDIIPIPETKEPTKEKKEKCRKDPCPDVLPIHWPKELPDPPGPRDLKRTSKGEREWLGIDRGIHQKELRKIIDEAKLKEVLPDNICKEQEVEWNDPMDAHHKHPLYLGGEDAPFNLCALRNDLHEKGHSKLDDQREMLSDSTWIACRICNGFLRRQPAGQRYYIAGLK